MADVGGNKQKQLTRQRHNFISLVHTQANNENNKQKRVGKIKQNKNDGRMSSPVKKQANSHNRRQKSMKRTNLPAHANVGEARKHYSTCQEKK